MSDGVRITVVGAPEVAERLRRTGLTMAERLAPLMERLMIALRTTVAGGKLSGQVLKNRTGHLRASIAEQVTTDGTKVTGKVGIFSGPTLVYGRVHEYGFTGPVQVREHVRIISQAFGHPIPDTATTVRAYVRQVNLPERSFLRSALAEQRDAIVAGIRAGLAEAVHAA
jgi:hypothetical protein